MKQALIFPGQGSQSVGMGKELAAAFVPAREAFEEVDDVLGQRLSKLMFEGPEDELTLTENAQPAIMAVSMAVFRVLETEGGFSLADRASWVAGHSLGEYSALTAAGALTLTEAAGLLRIRGRAMQDAAPVGVGAMAAILGLDLEAVVKVVAAAVAEGAEGDVCTAANDNAPGQVVVSGHAAAVERAVVLAKEAGARRVIMLPVSVPTHSALMAPVAEIMDAALAEVALGTPAVPVVANVKAEAISAPDEIHAALVAQVTDMVRWRESVMWMADQGVEKLVEVGAGKILSGLTRRIDKELETQSLSVPADIEAFL
ncbi:MAG: ACP S-malonyltransferase [Alphaproteobacteria bacterium]|nr:ACP S-malonyltransferase [Alphaproteobacteria bacterium]